MSAPDAVRGWLGRPVLRLAVTREAAAWALLGVFAIVTRSWMLGVRAMSHDESIHAYMSFNLFDAGIYQHDPVYHGPFLYHVNALVYFLFGATDATARLAPALAGIGLVFAAYLLRRQLGGGAALLAGLLIAISPSLTFYSRYIRNDVYIALFALLVVYCVFRYLERPRNAWLYRATLVLALAFATKENSFIFGVTLGSFLCLLALVHARRGGSLRRSNPAADTAALLLSLVLPFAGAVGFLLLGWPLEDYADPAHVTRNLGMVGVFSLASVALGWGWFGRRSADAGPGFRTWLGLAGMFWAIELTLYTVVFTDFPRGVVSGTLGSLAYWLTQHGVERGSQPIYYYAVVGPLYGALPILLSLGGTIAIARRGFLRAPLPAFLAWWTWGSWLLYSAAGERMPWLWVHIALPSCLLGAWWLSLVVQRVDWRGADRRSLWLLAAAPLLLILGARLALGSPFGGRAVEAVASRLQWVLALGIAVAVVFGVARFTLGLGRGDGRRLLGLGLVIALALFTVRASFWLNYTHYDLATEPLVYAHGTPDIKRALDEIASIKQRLGDARVAMDDECSWPLTWYLRDYPDTRYYGNAPTLDAMRSPIVLVGPANYAEVRPHVIDDYERRTYRLSWWPQEGYRDLTFAKAVDFVRVPERRRLLWEIVMHRRYPGSTLARWPVRKEFEMWVRRDVAARVWDLGVAPVARVQSAPVGSPAIVAVHATVHDGRALDAPRAVALGPGDERVIADTGNHRIVVLDEAGGLELAFGSRCSLRTGEGCTSPEGHGQFDEPWGIAVDEDGAIFVADTWNGRIQRFAPDGRFLSAWGGGQVFGEGANAKPLYGPRGLALLGDGRLIVADTGNKRLVVFERDGSFVRTVGRGGIGPGEFDEPVGVAVDGRTGEVYVADAWNRRVQRLGPDLEPRAEWRVRGWRSEAAGDKPYIAVHGDRVFVSDPENARVEVYDREGALVRTLMGTLADGERRFGRPAGLAIDAAEPRLLVADSGRMRLLEVSLAADPSGLAPR